MKAIIPTGGRGTRMRPLTFSSNKHFIPVANKPLIFYPIETIAETGITEIAITYNPPNLELVKSYLGDGSRWGVNLTFVEQPEPLGLAHIYQVCEEFIDGDSFVFHLGDNIFTEGIVDQVRYFEKEKPNGMVTMVHHKENHRLGVPFFNAEGQLLQYVEKPSNPPHDFAIPGLYFFDSHAFDVFKGTDAIQPSARGEYEIPTAYQWLIDHGLRVDVVEYNGTWLDPGKFDDWIESNQYMLDTRLRTSVETELDSTSSYENRVQIGKNCEIYDSHIRGPVIIGDNVKIVSSYIGPYTSISDKCSIEMSHVENSVLMEGVTVSHVGQPIDSSLIGASSVVTSSGGPTSSVELFIGDKSVVRV
jgi:glucose-1-phosphate thymidylyltransferase